MLSQFPRRKTCCVVVVSNNNEKEGMNLKESKEVVRGRIWREGEGSDVIIISLT